MRCQAVPWLSLGADGTSILLMGIVVGGHESIVKTKNRLEGVGEVFKANSTVAMIVFFLLEKSISFPEG